MIDSTAIILTRDEERNIETCIRRLKGFAARIVVVDSGSTDRTLDIARELGADIFVHEPYVDYGAQFNWAIEHTGIDTEWIMRVDADEYWTPELCAEVEALVRQHAHDDVNGILTESIFFFMGRRILHGERKRRKIVVFRRNHGYIEKRRRDQHTIVEDGRVIEAKHRFEHNDFKDLDSWIRKMDTYATREVDDYFTDREKYRKGTVNLDGVADASLSGRRKLKFRLYYRMPKFFRCWLLFIYIYIFRLGFLDGREGYVYNYMFHRWYRSPVDAKILERELEDKGIRQ